MDGFGFTDRNSSARKKRSDVRRRPHSQPFPEPNDISSFSSRVPPDNNEHGRSEESDESSLNDSLQGSNGERYSRVYSNRHSNIIMTPTKWKDITKVGNVGNVVYASDGLEKDNKVKKVKLKVGGVTHTIHANSTPDGNSTVGSISPNSSNVSNFHRTRQKLLLQHNSDDKCSFNFDKRTGLRLEDSSKSGYSFVKGDHSWGPEKNIFMKQSDICEPTRKSKRISKRRPVHEAPDDEYDQDGETQYLEKAATVLRSGKQRRELRLARALEDTDYIEELFSDDEPEFKRKKMRKDLVDSKKDNKKEMTITTRQRALQIGKGSSSAFGASVMEFPDGLPPPPPRKQKEKLSDVELQLKKAEAAQTRRTGGASVMEFPDGLPGGNANSGFSENVPINSQEVYKVLKSIDHGSSEESIFVSELAAEKVNINFVPEELPHDQDDAYLECTSTVATSACSDRVRCDVECVDSKVKGVSGIIPCKLEAGDQCNKSIGKGTGGQLAVYNVGTDSLAIAKPSSRKDIIANMYNSAKLPLGRDPIPNASFSKQRNDGAFRNRDKDEKFSGYGKSGTKYKALRQPARIGKRRIRKLLTSKYWQVAPKLKDSEPFTNNQLCYDKRRKAIHHKRKRCYNPEKCHGDCLHKKQKMRDQNTLLIAKGGLSREGVSGSLENGHTGDEKVQLSSYHGVDGLPFSVTAHQHSLHSQDSHVKFSIKSFKVPEFYIEVPESATVGSLKRTVMEAVTSLLGDGLRVGLLYQGKKVRDDNRTLTQAGITSKENMDMLGFTLEPNHGQDPSPLHANNSPILVSDIPHTLNRSVSNPVLDSRVSNASSDKPVLPIMYDGLASNPEQVSPQPDKSVEKTIEDTKALVSFCPSVEALDIVPADQKTKKSENVQRRTRRPFSVAEVEALVKAVEEIGTGRWRDIKLCAFENADHRTYVDLKDKWKTLVHTAQISPQQRRGEPVPQELLERVLAAHAYWSQHQGKTHGKNQVGSLKSMES